MAFIPIPNSASLCFNFVTAGQNWQFCLTIRKSTGAPTTGDLATLVTQGHSWYAATLKSLIYSSTSLKSIIATDQTVQGGPQAITTYNEAGTASGGLIPVGTPLVVSLRTALRGRSYRGRVYVSGLSSTFLTDAANISSGYAASFGSAFLTLLSSLATAGFDIVVASKQHNGAVTSPAATNPVIAFVVDTFLDSQRRRLAGRGT